MKSLLILGAGGFGQMVKETAIQLGYEEIVFLDDAAFGKDVVGKCCDYTAKYGEYKMAVAAFWEYSYEVILDRQIAGGRI